MVSRRGGRRPNELAKNMPPIRSSSIIQQDLVVGAHIVRHNAAEVINTFALAMKFHTKASELADFMWAYPTNTSDLKYMVK